MLLQTFFLLSSTVHISSKKKSAALAKIRICLFCVSLLISLQKEEAFCFELLLFYVFRKLKADH